ncbi:MAG: dihydrofolate reductase [Akkermansia sp.]
MSIRFSAVVGMAADRAIGKDGTMPWHLPEDLKVFRQLTTGHPILMGRKTYDSIGRPLPKRQNIVLSRQADLAYEGAQCITDIKQLAAMELMDEEIMVIGGAEIYSMMLPQITTLWVSEIEGEFEADTYFPEFKHHFPHREEVEQFAGFKLIKYTRCSESP